MEERIWQKMKEIELGLADELVRVCGELGTACFLAYGSMLGAVRHGGFIPWDDDMDFMMPRPDYDRFVALAPARLAPAYRLRTPAEAEYIHLFVKLDDARTTLAESVNRGSGYRGGIYIDIFPVDGLPAGARAARRHVKRCNRLWRAAALSFANMDYRTDYPRWKKLASRLLRLRDGRRYLARLDRAVRAYPYTTSGRVFVAGEPQTLPRALFDESAVYPFEDRNFPGVRDYETYLTLAYGDYRTPPPPERRGSPHAFDALDPERSYEETR